MRADITHLRRVAGFSGYVPQGLIKKHGTTPEPKGGVTSAIIIDEDGEIISSGVAVCSDQDNFCRRTGRAIAVGRAFKKIRVS